MEAENVFKKLFKCMGQHLWALENDLIVLTCFEQMWRESFVFVLFCLFLSLLIFKLSYCK